MAAPKIPALLNDAATVTAIKAVTGARLVHGITLTAANDTRLQPAAYHKDGAGNYQFYNELQQFTHVDKARVVAAGGS